MQFTKQDGSKNINTCIICEPTTNCKQCLDFLNKYSSRLNKSACSCAGSDLFVCVNTMLQCGCLNGSLFSSALGPPLHFASLWIKWMHGTVFTQGKIPTEKQGQGLVSLIIDNHLGWCVSLGCLVGEKVM